MTDKTMQHGTQGGEFSQAELQSALFAQLVMQQSNLAMMLLGKVPHPEGGQSVRDLDSAKLFIDQLEMLETKTKGNLSKEEEMLLKQNLMALRMAFVEAVESPEPQTKPSKGPAPSPAHETTSPVTPEDKTAPMGDAGGAGETESRKRYSKKFSL